MGRLCRGRISRIASCTWCCLPRRRWNQHRGPAGASWRAHCRVQCGPSAPHKSDNTGKEDCTVDAPWENFVKVRAVSLHSWRVHCKRSGCHARPAPTLAIPSEGWSAATPQAQDELKLEREEGKMEVDMQGWHYSGLFDFPTKEEQGGGISWRAARRLGCNDALRTQPSWSWENAQPSLKRSTRPPTATRWWRNLVGRHRGGCSPNYTHHAHHEGERLNGMMRLPSPRRSDTTVIVHPSEVIDLRWVPSFTTVLKLVATFRSVLWPQSCR